MRLSACLARKLLSFPFPALRLFGSVALGRLSGSAHRSAHRSRHRYERPTSKVHRMELGTDPKAASLARKPLPPSCSASSSSILMFCSSLLVSLSWSLSLGLVASSSELEGLKRKEERLPDTGRLLNKLTQPPSRSKPASALESELNSSSFRASWSWRKRRVERRRRRVIQGTWQGLEWTREGLSSCSSPSSVLAVL